MFYKPYNIDTNNIILKKPLLPYFYPIKYGGDTPTNIIIQTPIMFIPFGISTYNKSNYIDISFKNLTNNLNIDEFYDFIFSINSHFINLKKFKKYTFINSLKKSNDFFPHTLKLKYTNDILIFNEDNIEIPQNNIKPNLYSKFIIQLSNLWVNHKDKKYGVIWSICQIKLFNNLVFKPTTFAFIDDTPKITNKTKYESYFKMLKRGVPLFGVKQKLIIDKLDPSIIDNPNDIYEPDTNNQLSNNHNHISNHKKLLFSDIKNKPFSLKKMSIPKNNTLKSTKSNLLIPSQKDIVQAMKNLKKIVIL